MAALRRFPVRLVALLALVPVAWWLVGRTTTLGGRLNNIAMEWLYKFRGEIPAVDGTQSGDPPLNVVYVDIDSAAVAALGDRPWSRGRYAVIIDDVCKYGKPKAVGLDFILSPTGSGSDMLDPKKVKEGNELMSEVVRAYPQAVLAVKYSDSYQPFASLMADVMKHAASDDPKDQPPYSSRPSRFPFIYEGAVNPIKNGYPESPTYPLIDQDHDAVGLVNTAPNYNPGGLADDVPRWIPLFAETYGPEHTINLIFGKITQDGLSPDSMGGDEKQVFLMAPDGLVQMPTMQHKVFYNMAVELAVRYLGLEDKSVRRTPEALSVVKPDGTEALHIPLKDQQLVEVNWFSHWISPYNPRVSALEVTVNADALEGGNETQKAAARKFFDRTFKKDAIVLIGPVDDTLKDLSPTPFDANPVPEVGVYGNLLKTFFSGEYIHRPPDWVNPALQFGLTALVGALAMYNRRGATMAKLGAMVVLVAYVYGVLEAFAKFTLVLPLMVPVGSAFTTAFVGAIVRLIDEEKQKKRIKGMFGTYLAPEVVNDMVESGQEPQLGGHNVVLTCFFSDVQGFSSFSEVMTPDKLTNLMNEYLTAMTDILQAEKGSLDKYIGDAIVAMYGAPVDLKDHALRACVATCRMHARLGELRQKWISEGDKWPERVHKMRMRIGLNTGEAIVGNMGSANRFNYTMMGDTVNLAARCESGAKQFGVYAMCTEDTRKAAEAQGGGIVFRRLNKIVVKGKTQPVEVHEIVALQAEAAPETLRCVELFEKALELYFAQKWDEAKAQFAEAQKLEPLQPGRDPGVAHNPSELMQEWCDEMKADPPAADWNGVLEMKEK
jgi:adenylate cyclase